MTPVEISNKTATTKGSIIKEFLIFNLDSDKSHEAEKKIETLNFVYSFLCGIVYVSDSFDWEFRFRDASKENQR